MLVLPATVTVPGFVRMPQLPVASFCPCQIPTILFKKSEDLLDLHGQMIKQLLRLRKIRMEMAVTS